MDKRENSSSGTAEFSPRGMVKRVQLFNGNVKGEAAKNSGEAYITNEGRISLDGKIYSVGSSAFLFDEKFYSEPPKELVELIEKSIDAHVETLIEESAKIDRKAIAPERIDDFLGFRYWDTSVRYRNLSGEEHNQNSIGRKIDEITTKHSPKAIHDEMFKREMEKYRFEIGGILHVLDEKPLTLAQAQAIRKYQQQGGRLGRTALVATIGESEAQKISERVYDING